MVVNQSCMNLWLVFDSNDLTTFSLKVLECFGIRLSSNNNFYSIGECANTNQDEVKKKVLLRKPERYVGFFSCIRINKIIDRVKYEDNNRVVNNSSANYISEMKSSKFIT